MKRRSDAPLTILVIGIAAVVLLGVGVINYTGQTPVLQLPPLIKKTWGYSDVVARFRRGSPPCVEVELPAAAGADRLRMAQVGALALEKYLELAPTTQVESVVVSVKDRPEAGRVTVNRMFAEQLKAATDDRPRVLDAAQKADVYDVEVQVLGLSASGVDLRVTGKARRPDAADRTAAAITSIAWVGRVEVELEGSHGGPVTSLGGRDVPRSRRPR